MFNNCFDDLQVTDRRPFTAEDRVQSQPSLCQICGEQEWHLDMLFSQYSRFQERSTTTTHSSQT